MKKSFFSLFMLIIILIPAINANAQIRFGVKAGCDVSEIRIKSNVLTASNRLGYFIGGTLEALVPASGLGGEISILYGRTKYSVTPSDPNATLTNYDYITIPLHLKQRIKIIPNLGIFFSGGPYAEVKIDGLNIQETIDVYKSKDFALGLSAAAGINVLNRADVFVQFRSELTNRFSSEYMDAGIFQNKNFQFWTVGATFYF